MQFNKSSKSYEVTLCKLSEILERIDPDIHYGDWIRVLMAIYYETGGTEEGFDLADEWSSKGKKYMGYKDVYRKWRCFKPDHKRPIKMGTLIKIANES